MGEGKALIPGGYIIIARSIVESEVWKKPPLYLKVWLYLLHTAQFKPYKNLKKGQLFVTIKDIQEGCSWFVGCRKSTATKDQIFQILDWMRKPSVSHMKATTKATMITTTKATHGILITIDNYCVYQNPKLYESNDEGNTENDTKAIGEQRTTNNINKEGSKKVKNDKKDVYGSFQNVFLFPQEYEKLLNEFSCTNEAVEFLSQYIEEKGYKSKSHYLAIRRWVIDAVAKKNGGSNERVLRSKHEQSSSTGHSGGGNSASKIPEGFWG